MSCDHIIIGNVSVTDTKRLNNNAICDRHACILREIKFNYRIYPSTIAAATCTNLLAGGYKWSVTTRIFPLSVSKLMMLLLQATIRVQLLISVILILPPTPITVI